jgi:hypothetical protein
MAQSAVSATNQVDASLTLEAAHARFLNDTSVQLAHSDRLLKDDKEVAPWLASIIDAIGEFLRAFSPVISFFFWVGLALLIGLLVYFLVTEVMGVQLFKFKPKAAASNDAPDWRPDTQEARDLLAAADKLASEGNFNEAVHLILLRSIEHIDRFRPLAVRPALTAREIGAMPSLPDPARPIFVRIASAVERTLFAGMNIDQNEFRACRQAYADFALPAGWRT